MSSSLSRERLQKGREYLESKGFTVVEVVDGNTLLDEIEEIPDDQLVALIGSGNIEEILKAMEGEETLSTTERALRMATGKDWVRFDKHLSSKDKNGCINWKSSSRIGEYGCFRLKGISVYAHRVALFRYSEKHNLPWYPKLLVRHLCPVENKLCCNPEHLKQGTAADNGADYAKR